jgi:hypothetical protein
MTEARWQTFLANRPDIEAFSSAENNSEALEKLQTEASFF